MPASQMIMDIIGSAKFDESKVNGYACVLMGVEGPRYAILKLQDRFQEEKDKNIQKQYDKVMSCVRKLTPTPE
jgi:hypothetical protein